MKKRTKILIAVIIILSIVSLLILFAFPIVDANSPYSFATKWGSRGTGDGQFSAPQGVAVDSSNNVYVVDVNNDRVQKFNSNGNFITKWGSAGTGHGQFDVPEDVAVDLSNNVYVVDTSKIQKFNSNGNFITIWGSRGTGDGQFDHARGIDVDTSNNVYVADSQNDRIQKFVPPHHTIFDILMSRIR